MAVTQSLRMAVIQIYTMLRLGGSCHTDERVPTVLGKKILQ